MRPLNSSEVSGLFELELWSASLFNFIVSIEDLANHDDFAKHDNSAKKNHLIVMILTESYQH